MCLPLRDLLAGFTCRYAERLMPGFSKPMSKRYSILSCVLALGLGACASAPHAPAPPADESLRAAVAAIRASRSGEDSALEVTPLRDPAVEGFLARAHSAEQAGELQASADAIRAARELAPEAPDLLQMQAEITFLQGDLVVAEQLAYQSFQRGPQLGDLCVRNWQTIIEARKLFGDADYLPFAEGKREQCKVRRPVRL